MLSPSKKRSPPTDLKQVELKKSSNSRESEGLGQAEPPAAAAAVAQASTRVENPAGPSVTKKIKIEEVDTTLATGAVWTIDRTKGTVAQSSTGSSKEEKINASAVYMMPVSIQSLFPANLLRGSKVKPDLTPSFYQMASKPTNNNPGEDFETTISNALKLCFMTIAQRKQYSNIAQDDFKRKEKTARLEMQRFAYRSATRLLPNGPERLPLSTILNPSLSLNVAPILNSMLVDRLPMKSAEQLQKDKERVFYASIPVSVMREDIEKRIWNKNYFWSLAAKNNGIHLVLMWCTFYGEPMWLFVDRAYTIYRVVIDDFPLPSILFDGTVLDGELVPLQQGGFAFEVYDCIQACGVPCGELNYLIRQQNAYHALHVAGIPKDNRYGLELRVKPIFRHHDIVSFLYDYLPTMDHDRDGFIWTAVDAPVQPGQAKVLVDGEWNATIYKLKNGCDNTIEFVIRAQNNQWEFFVWDEPYLKLWAREDAFAFETPEQVSEALGLQNSVAERSKEEINAAIHEQIIECRYSKLNKHWRFELFRKDKTLPNSLTTAKKTWQNIQENLTLLDMVPPGSLPEGDRQKVAEWERMQELQQHKQKKKINIETGSRTTKLSTEELPSFEQLCVDVKPKSAAPLAPVLLF